MEFGNGKALSQWSFFALIPNATNENYSRADHFDANKDDAFLDKGSAPGFYLFVFRLNSISVAIPPGIGLGFARIDMDVKEHMFSPQHATWAKKAELIPSQEEAIAII